MKPNSAAGKKTRPSSHLKEQSLHFMEHLTEILTGKPHKGELIEPELPEGERDGKVLGLVDDRMCQELFTYRGALIDQFNEMPQPRRESGVPLYNACRLQLQTQIDVVYGLIKERINITVPDLPPDVQWGLGAGWKIIQLPPPPAAEYEMLIMSRLFPFSSSTAGEPKGK